MARKMVLLPAEMQHSLSTPRNPITHQLSQLDSEMRSILDDLKIPPDEKLLRYYNTLNRYEILEKDYRKIPVPVRITPGLNSQIEPTTRTVEKEPALPLPESELLSLVPKSKKKNAALLLNYVKNNPALSWNPQTKELIYGGTTVGGSNILSLLNDFSRDSKQHPPLGWEQFAAALKQKMSPRKL